MKVEHTKDEIKAFIREVLCRVDHKELLCQRDGQRKLMHMWLAAATVAGIVKPDLKAWAANYETARTLDAIEAFCPEHPLALEWTALKKRRLKPATRARGRGAEYGRNLLAFYFVDYLSKNGLMPATRNHHEASKLKGERADSACDAVAEVLNELCAQPITYDAIRNAWEKRSELLGTIGR